MANFLKSLFVKGIEIDPAGATSDQILKYNGTKFAPASAGAVGLLDDLTDVVVSSPTNNQVLKYNASSGLWANASASGVDTINDLGDVIVTTPSNGQALVYDGTNWVNGTSGLADNAVTTAKIANSNVTAEKLAPNAVLSNNQVGAIMLMEMM